MREAVRWDPGLKAWTVSDHELAGAILRSREFSTDPASAADSTLKRVAPNRVGRASGALLYMDPPMHTELRVWVQRVLARYSQERLADLVEQVVGEVLTALQTRSAEDGRRTFRILSDLALPVSIGTIGRLLGLDDEHHHHLHAGSFELAKVVEAAATGESSDTIREVALPFFGLILREVRARQREPRDDLITGLLNDQARPSSASTMAIVMTVMSLFLAGHVTTMNLIGNGLRALLEHPDQYELLRADPTLARSAVEELLRFDPPFQLAPRYPLRDMELGGQEVRCGERIVVLLQPVNRDPGRFPDEGRLDIRRSQNPHLTFGAGIHRCPGAAISRLEATVLLQRLPLALPDLRLESAVEVDGTASESVASFV
jgi:cytochrome P450